MADDERSASGAGARDYTRLPEPIRLADTITSQDTVPVPDPEGGRDSERDFMLRYAG